MCSHYERIWTLLLVISATSGGLQTVHSAPSELVEPLMWDRQGLGEAHAHQPQLHFIPTGSRRITELNPELIESVLNKFFYDDEPNTAGIAKTIAGDEWSMAHNSRRKKELNPFSDLGLFHTDIMTEFPEGSSLPSAFRLKKRNSDPNPQPNPQNAPSTANRIRKTRSDAFRLKRSADAFRLKRMTEAFRLKRNSNSFRLKKDVWDQTKDAIPVQRPILSEDSPIGPSEAESFMKVILMTQDPQAIKRDFNPSYRLKRDLSNAYRLRKRNPQAGYTKDIDANVKMTPSYRL